MNLHNTCTSLKENYWINCIFPRWYYFDETTLFESRWRSHRCLHLDPGWWFRLLKRGEKFTESDRKTPEIDGTWKQYSGRKFFGYFPVTFRPFPAEKHKKMSTIHRKKSGDFPAGIMFPCSIDCRCFPAGIGLYFLTWVVVHSQHKRIDKVYMDNFHWKLYQNFFLYKTQIIILFHLDVEIQFFDQVFPNVIKLDQEYQHDLLPQ